MIIPMHNVWTGSLNTRNAFTFLDEVLGGLINTVGDDRLAGPVFTHNTVVIGIMVEDGTRQANVIVDKDGDRMRYYISNSSLGPEEVKAITERIDHRLFFALYGVGLTD